MSVAGIDFGNLNLLIGQTSKGGVDVILNESSNRQTATYVSISGKQRFIGDSGAAMARSNIKNTISTMKMLVGRKFDDEGVQAEVARLPYETCKLPSGGVGISIMYNDAPMVVSAEHAMAMMLVKAKDTSTKANNNVNIGDAVLAVPHWFTEAQRRGVLQACEIASLNCLKVTSESTNVALSYGIFKSAKKLFSETEPQHVLFIDIGYVGYSVTIVDFIQENMKVRACVCDGNLGGRDFDNIIIEYLAEQFEAKTKINVRGNKKAVLKLQAAAEKAKKTLSPSGVNEVNVSVECLAEDRDLAVVLKRDEFESRAASLVARLQAPIDQCLAEAGLTKEQLAECEVVGGTSRVNLIKRTLGELLGLDPAALNYGLKTTMNADEAVARGGALQCAMLSSRVRVKPFAIVDVLPYGINATFDCASEEGGEKPTTVSMYARGDEVPHKPRRLTFKNKTADFDVTLSYDDAAKQLLPAGENLFLSRFTVQLPADVVKAAGPNLGDVRVTWNLDKHGFVFVQSAQLMQEVPYTPEEVAAYEAAEAAKAAEAESKDSKEAAEDKDAAEGKDSKEAAEGKDSKDSEAPAAAAAVVDVSKKRFKKTELKVLVQTNGLTAEEVKAALELEASMAFEDKLITETADKRNELEAYIYSTRDKLDGTLKTFASEEEKSTMKGLLLDAEDWLYGDGFEATKTQYARRLEELRTVGDKSERRLQEANNRSGAVDGLKKQLELCKAFASKYGEDYAHIEEEERDQLRAELRKTEEWMYDQISAQGSMPTHEDPVLTVEAINVKRNALFKVSNPIMTKPKPKPAEPTPAPASASATPPPAPAADADADAKAAEGAADDKKGTEGQEDGAQPMDQAKDDEEKNDSK